MKKFNKIPYVILIVMYMALNNVTFAGLDFSDFANESFAQSSLGTVSGHPHHEINILHRQYAHIFKGIRDFIADYESKLNSFRAQHSHSLGAHDIRLANLKAVNTNLKNLVKIQLNSLSENFKNDLKTRRELKTRLHQKENGIKEELLKISNDWREMSVPVPAAVTDEFRDFALADLIDTNTRQSFFKYHFE